GAQAPGYQPRGARPNPVAADGVDGGFGHPRMGGEVQVIIGGEKEDPASFQLDFGAGGGIDRAQSPEEGAPGQGIQAGAEHDAPHTPDLSGCQPRRPLRRTEGCPSSTTGMPDHAQ